MKHLNKLIFWIAIATLGLLVSCSTMSVEECKVARWNDVGLRDGMAGEPLSKLNELSKDCAEAKVVVDTRAYMAGRDQGLYSYCQLPNAVRLGLDGKYYNGVCPAAIDGEFRRRVNVGREVRDSREQVRSLDNRRIDLENKLRNAGSDDARKKLRDDLSDNDRNLRRARDRVRDAEYNLDRVR